MLAFPISLIILYPTGTTEAATIHIPSDQPTIQEGLDAADTGDLVLVAPGTYVENLVFGMKTITLESESGASATVIDGGECTQGSSSCSVINFNDNPGGIILDGFTIRNGEGSSRDIGIDYNTPKRSARNGGGIYIAGTSPKILNCIIKENTAYLGGGLYLSNSSAEIRNCMIIDNVGQSFGGGLRCFESTPTIIDCMITGNTTEEEGGGIDLSRSDAFVINCTILGNNAGEVGGGILIWSCDPTIQDCLITDNFADWYGGGIKGYATSPLIIDCEISVNSSGRRGGGVFFFNCISISIEGSTISKNFVQSNDLANYGGGLWIEGTEDTALINCIIKDNYAPDNGGGLAMEYATMTISNCVFMRNRAGESGGGISCYGNHNTPVLANSTLTGNVAGVSGGGIWCKSIDLLTVTNSILWNDSAPEGPEVIVVDDATMNVSFSDIQGGEEAVSIEPSATLNWQEGNIEEDPQFVVAEDFHLRAGSPCIDAGTDAGVDDDLDGDTRPHGSGFDMGVDEYTGPRWVLHLDAEYDEGALQMEYLFWALGPAQWANFLILTTPSFRVIPLWSISLPAIDPPFSLPVALPFPSLGMIGIYSGLFTAGGSQAVDLVWVSAEKDF